MRFERTDGRIHTTFECGCTEFTNVHIQRSSIHYECPHRTGQRVPMFSLMRITDGEEVRWDREKNVAHPLPGHEEEFWMRETVREGGWAVVYKGGESSGSGEIIREAE